jgi:methionyl-tRNA synthetase
MSGREDARVVQTRIRDFIEHLLARGGGGVMGGQDEGTVLITTPPPTTNGPLHLGHLAGPYVAADVAARFCRKSGDSVLTMSGLDDHQNYVVVRAKQLGMSPEQTRREYGARIRSGFGLAGVEYDIFVQPGEDEQYRAAIRRFLEELVDLGRIREREIVLASCRDCATTMHHGYVTGVCSSCHTPAAGGTCEGCGRFLTASDLSRAACSLCGGDLGFHAVAGAVFELERYRDLLTATWARMALPPHVRELVGHYATEPLPEIAVSYPSDWGIERASEPGQRIDVWIEMALGYLYCVSRHLDGDSLTLRDAVTSWTKVEQMWHFLGIDNAFYYAVLFPALLSAAGLDVAKLAGLVVNEFYRLDSEKFSTSRNHAIWVEEFLAEHDAGALRLFLGLDRPDGYESSFGLGRYEFFEAELAGLQSLFARGEKSVDGESWRSELERAVRSLNLEHFNLPLAIRCLLRAHSTDGGGDVTALLETVAGRRNGRVEQRA